MVVLPSHLRSVGRDWPVSDHDWGARGEREQTMGSAFRTFKLIMTTMLTIPAINIPGQTRAADKLSSSMYIFAGPEVPVLTIMLTVNEILDPTLGNIAIKNYEL